MSFHFQPQADSSDEEETVDISTWKSSAPKPANRLSPSPPTAAIEVMNELAEAIKNEDDEEDESAIFQGDLINRAEPSEDDKIDGEEEEEQDAIVVSAFNPVNKATRTQAPISLPESNEDELGTPEKQKQKQKLQLPTRTRRAKSRPSRTPKEIPRVLVPVIPRLELDSSEAEEILDFTVGSDVVRRVKKELQGRDGDIVYQVEFEDRHAEEVRKLSFFIYCAGTWLVRRLSRLGLARYWHTINAAIRRVLQLLVLRHSCWRLTRAYLHMVTPLTSQAF
jgi:hypothetical protein